MITSRESFPRAAGFLLACALGWSLVHVSLLVFSHGLLASYDFPGHLHMSAVQMRSPTALWDDAWYAGYPTYAYPPLAHRIAGELMERLGMEAGFKAAVTLAYVAAVPAFYAAARAVGGLSAVPAAAATLAATVSPALFRAFLFGQYPSLLAYSLFLGALAALVASLASATGRPLVMLLAMLLVAALGSTHLYALALLLVALVPLAAVTSVPALIPRITPPLLGGCVLALLPSWLWLTDLHLLAKTPVPHITRSMQMVSPAGLLEWVVSPAGIPVVAGALVVGFTCLPGGKRWGWIGLGAAVGLTAYLRDELGLLWTAVTLVCIMALAAALRWLPGQPDWRTRYLAGAGILSLWLALGPAGGLARLLPFADVLVYDRPLLYGTPLACLALTRLLATSTPPPRWKRVSRAALVLSAVPLMALSVVHVLRTYGVLVPAAEGALPRGTPLRASYADILARQESAGRLLPLGLPPIVYTLPDVTGTPLIDGAYNDARVLEPLRTSGIEALGNEKFIHRDLRVTRYFLAQADRYSIEWILTGDRYYDPVIPLDRFMLVYESGPSPTQSIRLYRSLIAPRYAWIGDHRYPVSEVTELSLHDGDWGRGGRVSRLDTTPQGAAIAVRFSGPSEPGWVFTEQALPAAARGCNRIEFDAWSPTGAALTVRVRQRGEWALLRPEAPLPPDRASVQIAVDCRTTDRVSIALSGRGVQRAVLTPVRFQRVEDATRWVPLQRQTSECVRTDISTAGAPVVLSVPYFPRWRAADSKDPVVIRPDRGGLLTVSGSPGPHTLCLSFPETARLFRAFLPLTYLGLALFVAVFLGADLSARFPSAKGPVRLLLGLTTGLREIARRRKLQAEDAWDRRAREAPDWYATCARDPEEARELAEADLAEVLRGVDRQWLEGATVLDIGCGPGRLLQVIAPLAARAYGADISGAMVALAQERLHGLTNVTIVKNDGHTLSQFADASCDLVYCVNVFQHIPVRAWIESYMSEIHRVLKAGGVAKVQVDGRGESRLWRLAAAIVGHDSWAGSLFTRRELVEMARKHGFVVVRCGYASDGGVRWSRQALWLHARRP